MTEKVMTFINFKTEDFIWIDVSHLEHGKSRKRGYCLTRKLKSRKL
jgi:hypothetical protein